MSVYRRTLLQAAMAGDEGRLETSLRERELRWRADNPEAAAVLSQLVGHRVMTTRALPRMDGTSLPEGTCGVALEHAEGKLLVDLDGSATCVLLKAQWLTAAPRAELDDEGPTSEPAPPASAPQSILNKVRHCMGCGCAFRAVTRVRCSRCRGRK